VITLKATVPGPWGPIGSEFHVKEIGKYQHYVGNGVLVEVDTYAGMSAKERAVARAEALGLDTSGTQKQIQKRIDEFESQTPDPTDVPSTPGEGTVGPADTTP
jgi:hypothetical protein